MARQTRIRYIKSDKPGIWVSHRYIMSDKTGALYRIEVNKEEVTYRIINIRNWHVVKRGGEDINNIEVLYRKIKKDLKGLGVKFGSDIRETSVK